MTLKETLAAIGSAIISLVKSWRPGTYRDDGHIVIIISLREWLSLCNQGYEILYNMEKKRSNPNCSE